MCAVGIKSQLYTVFLSLNCSSQEIFPNTCHFLRVINIYIFKSWTLTNIIYIKLGPGSSGCTKTLDKNLQNVKNKLAWHLGLPLHHPPATTTSPPCQCPPWSMSSITIGADVMLPGTWERRIFFLIGISNDGPAWPCLCAVRDSLHRRLGPGPGLLALPGGGGRGRPRVAAAGGGTPAGAPTAAAARSPATTTTTTAAAAATTVQAEERPDRGGCSHQTETVLSPCRPQTEVVICYGTLCNFLQGDRRKLNL